MRNAEFNDPRLVIVYDDECTWAADDDFFLSAVNETAHVRVLDLGCGTGRLTLALAAAGHRVTGVDPAPASLAAARTKPGADRVAWVEGTSAVLPDASFDVAVMTSHVAQVFLTDDEWRRTLTDLKRSLVSGGRLVFDTRDPAARPWERWNPADSRRLIRLPNGLAVRTWTEVTGVDHGVVTINRHYDFADRDKIVSTSILRFRPEHDLRSSLQEAGFAVEEIYGGWHREPVGRGTGEFVMIARA